MTMSWTKKDLGQIVGYTSDMSITESSHVRHCYADRPCSLSFERVSRLWRPGQIIDRHI